MGIPLQEGNFRNSDASDMVYSDFPYNSPSRSVTRGVWGRQPPTVGGKEQAEGPSWVGGKLGGYGVRGSTLIL